VKLAGICSTDHPEDCWRTHMIVGEGPGGTFYQSFDITMAGLATCVSPTNDDQTTLLGCFNKTDLITVNWAFPSYTSFDKTVGAYGDISATASKVEKSVGQTWSDPAVGQVYSSSGPYSVLIGSGFLPYSTQHQANRADVVAGTTFYVLDAKTGAVLTTSDVGSDGLNENVDDCTTNVSGCKQIKNALQTDPVATGPSDSRFITKTYMGDLDGNVWRFDMSLDGSQKPTVTAKNKLYSAGSDQPIFSSMATVNVGGTNQYVFFGTGSDLLPSTDKNTIYHLLGVLDTGSATGSKSLDIPLSKTSTLSADERVTAFPAVAGDIVFFTTTTYKTSALCTAPDANLYGLTFIGGAAYDTDNNGKFDKNDSTLVKKITGQRATAPFIVDQHLVFGTQGKVSMFGDPDDYNNGIGQAGVRILSWREVR
jgi:Tfp pilus tip-associated adhesin PilY1